MILVDIPPELRAKISAATLPKPAEMRQFGTHEMNGHGTECRVKKSNRHQGARVHRCWCDSHQHVTVHQQVQKHFQHTKGQRICLCHKVGHVHVNSLIWIVELASFFHLEDIGVWDPNRFEISGEMIPPMQKEHVLDVELIDVCDHSSDMQNEPVANQLEEER